MILAILLLSMPFSRAAETAPPPAAENSAILPSEEMLNLRDPFKHPDVEASKAIVLTDLEKISVEQFKMVAVVTGPEHMRAMLAGPDGKRYTVRVGMKIGTRQGKIVKITPDKVEVKEKLVNVLGQEEGIDSEIPMISESAAVATAGPGGGPAGAQGVFGVQAGQGNPANPAGFMRRNMRPGVMDAGSK